MAASVVLVGVSFSSSAREPLVERVPGLVQHLEIESRRRQLLAENDVGDFGLVDRDVEAGLRLDQLVEVGRRLAEVVARTSAPRSLCPVRNGTPKSYTSRSCASLDPA